LLDSGPRPANAIREAFQASFVADTDAARKYVGLEGSTSASTRRQVSKNMLGADVLDSRKFPTATFQIESALHKKTKQGKPVVELKGELTLHGKARPLTLYAHPSQKEGSWNLRGDFSIRQTDFGITPYSAALGTVGVADQLKIFGDLWIAGDETTQE
jgi:polyisoprenoid-binding protein YceI